MAISLRIPPEKEKKIIKYAKENGLTKTALILTAIDEKLGIKKSRAQLLRDFSGWLSAEEASEINKAVDQFNQINPGDWE